MYEQPEPHRNSESPIPLKRFRISYLAYKTAKSKTSIRAYKIIWSHDIVEAERNSGVDPKLIYKIEQI